MKSRIHLYNKALGIKDGVSSEQLKTIYRERAKLLHPDRNPDVNSHDQFVLLHEAYEFYKQLLAKDSPNDPDKVFNSKKYPDHYYAETWNSQKRKDARRRASQRAKMKYKQFEEKGYFKRLDMMYFMLDVLRFLFALVLLIVLPIVSFLQEGVKGIIAILFIQFITYPLWVKAIKRFIN